MPLCIQLIVFWFWSNLLLPGLDIEVDDEFYLKDWEIFIDVVLRINSIYFLLIEIPELSKHKHKYFLDIEKLINLASSVLIMYNQVYKELESPTFWAL